MQVLTLIDKGYCHSVSVTHDSYDSVVTAYMRDGVAVADIQHVGVGVYAHYIEETTPTVNTNDTLDLGEFGQWQIVTRYGLHEGWVEPRSGQRANPNQPVTLARVSA